jgi:ATP-dependent Clp protease protease subunit
VGAEAAEELLFERGVVLVAGEVDGPAATAIAARLMTLDATGDDPVELRLSSARGPLDDALSLIDVLDVLGVEVHTVGFGAIEGGPVGILAAGTRRRLAPHARLCLREPEVAAGGTAADLERSLAALATRRDAFFDRLAVSTRRGAAEVASWWFRRAVLDATDAVSLGYADGLVEPPAGPGGSGGTRGAGRSGVTAADR